MKAQHINVCAVIFILFLLQVNTAKAFDIDKAISRLPSFNAAAFQGPSRDFKGMVLVGLPGKQSTNNRFLEAISHVATHIDRMPPDARSTVGQIGRVICDPDGRYANILPHYNAKRGTSFAYDPSAERPGVIIFHHDIVLKRPVETAIEDFLRLRPTGRMANGTPVDPQAVAR